jgi:hypothetical protein
MPWIEALYLIEAYFRIVMDFPAAPDWGPILTTSSNLA